MKRLPRNKIQFGPMVLLSVSIFAILLSSCPISELGKKPGSSGNQTQGDLKVANVVLSVSGGTYHNKVTTVVSCPTKGVSFRYTLDSTKPSESHGTLISSARNVTIDKSCTFKVLAYKSGLTSSVIRSDEFIFKVSPITFTPDHISFLDPTDVTINCATSDISIRYSFDSSTPTTTSGTALSAGGAINIASSGKLQVIAYKSGYTPTTQAVDYIVYVLKADTTISVTGGSFTPGTSMTTVTVNDFLVSPFEVTQADYEAYMDTNPSALNAGIGADYPVNKVSWNAAVTYCNKLSAAKGLSLCYSISSDNPPVTTCDLTAKGYRLPTEVEWEFAARGGASATVTIYAGSDTIGDVAWYNSNGESTSHEVGAKNPNELGIYDMSGNVYEWCWDYYGATYPTGGINNPKGPTSGSTRVVRGGNWNQTSPFCTVTNRDYFLANPTDENKLFGFRLVRRP